MLLRIGQVRLALLLPELFAYVLGLRDKSLMLTKHRCSQLILSQSLELCGSCCLNPELQRSVFCSLNLLGPKNAMRASGLPVRAFSSKPRIDLSPPLKDTQCVMETSDIADVSMSELCKVALREVSSCERLLNFDQRFEPLLRAFGS